MQAVELRERLRQLEAEAADLQGPSAIEMQQSAVEGMEAACVSISDGFAAARGSPARPGASSPSKPATALKHTQASLIRLSEMLRRKDTEIEVLKRTVNAECNYTTHPHTKPRAT